MSEFYQNHKRSIDRIAFLILISIVVYAFFTVLFAFLGPFFFGLLIALLMEPLIRFIVKRMKWKRWIASLVCLLIFLAIMSSLGAWLVTTLIRQVSSFVESAPYHIEEFSDRLDDFNVRLQRIGDNLPDGWGDIPEIQEMALTVVGTLFGEGMRDQGMRIATMVPNFFINLILMLVSAYFFMADREIIFSAVRKACPKWISGQMAQTKKGLSRAMGGYFRAQYILMAIIGIISIAGLLILGNQYALLLGLLFAILDFLPIVGTGAVLIPWALISLVAGNIHQAIGLAVMYGVITITRQVMQPKILGDQMGAHPLASLMSIFIGFRMFGLLGLVIGPSLLMIFVAIFETEQSTSHENEKMNPSVRK